MIEQSIKVHDQFRFEIKLGYDVEREEKYTHYDIETYLFIPKNLGISEDTYKREEFYNDTQTYIRFKTPIYLITEILKCENSPFNIFENSVEKLIVNPKTNSKEF